MASYQKMADGSWSARFRITSPEGKIIQKRLSGYSKKLEAERAYREFMASYVPPEIKFIEDGMTFQQLYTKFIEYKKTRLKTSSIYDINAAVGKHILPFFGEKPVSKITKHTVLEWQTKMISSKYSFKYKSTIRGFLSSIFKYGVMYCNLPLNPVSQVESFRNTEPKKEMQIWTKEEFFQFIDCVDDIVYKAFFSLLYFSGCRKCEILALSWEDINLQTGMLTISKSITRKIQGQIFAYTTTKNDSSNRKLLLPKICLESMQVLHNSSDTQKPFIFYGERPLPFETLKRHFLLYCEKAHVKAIRLHDFRHSHASLLIGNGENIVMVAKRLGHSNIEQTLNTYSHLLPNQEGEMIDKIDRIVPKVCRSE